MNFFLHDKFVQLLRVVGHENLSFFLPLRNKLMPISWLSNIDFVLEYSSSLNIVGCENGMIMRNTALSSDSVYTTSVT